MDGITGAEAEANLPRAQLAPMHRRILHYRRRSLIDLKTGTVSVIAEMLVSELSVGGLIWATHSQKGAVVAVVVEVVEEERVTGVTGIAGRALCA